MPQRRQPKRRRRQSSKAQQPRSRAASEPAKSLLGFAAGSVEIVASRPCSRNNPSQASGQAPAARLGGTMKPMALAISIAITMLATPGILAAQVSESHKAHHRYKLVDIRTFGGPTGYVAQDLGSTGSSSGVLNNRGALVGAADTSTPDPDYLPGNGFFPIDP